MVAQFFYQRLGLRSYWTAPRIILTSADAENKTHFQSV